MWPDAAETQDLLARFARNDAGAADALWELYRGPLRRMIGLRLGHGLDRRVDARAVRRA